MPIRLGLLFGGGSSLLHLVSPQQQAAEGRSAPSADSDDKLSFRAKISQATRVGLIEPLIEQALHAVHGGRNDFAHSAPGPTLAEPRRQMAFPPQARVRFSNS